jgi:methyl-accepting chemotaxis protein
MRGILDRSEQIKKMTDVQAGRSQRLREVTMESAERTKQTALNASEVVGITLEMQRLSTNLTRQVAQFKIKKGAASLERSRVEFEEGEDSIPKE